MTEICHASIEEMGQPDGSFRWCWFAWNSGARVVKSGEADTLAEAAAELAEWTKNREAKLRSLTDRPGDNPITTEAI